MLVVLCIEVAGVNQFQVKKKKRTLLIKPVFHDH